MYDSDTIIYHLLPYCITFELLYEAKDILQKSHYISDKLVYSRIEQVVVSQYYHLTNHSPTKALALVVAYKSDTTTYSLLYIV